MKPVKEVAECANSLEIVDDEVPADLKIAEHVSSFEIVYEKVPADFNTDQHQFNTDEDHSSQKRTTGWPDGFLEFWDGGRHSSSQFQY